MTLNAGLTLLILLAAAMHASWNALVKVGRDRLLTQGLVTAGSCALALAVIPFVAPPAPASWPFLLTSTLVHFAYYTFLLLAYRDGDLSQVYPLARGSAPALVAFGATFAAGERLALVQVAGVGLVSLGIVSLALERGLPRRRQDRQVTYALLTGLTIGVYSIADGLGVRRAGSELGYIAWLFLMSGLPVVAFVLAKRGRATIGFLRREWRPGIIGAGLSSASYGIAIWAMSLGAMAQIVSLRETSVIFGALIGALLLGESFGPRRIAAALAVAAGNVLLHLPG